jgi:hypothetical protein
MQMLDMPVSSKLAHGKVVVKWNVVKDGNNVHTVRHG